MTCSVLGSTCGTWAGMAFLACFSAAVWLGWFFWLVGKRAGILGAAIGAQLFWLGQIIITQLVLGWAGWLYPVALAALNALLTACIFLFFVRPRWEFSRTALSGWWGNVRRYRFPAFAKVFLILLAVLFLRSFLQAFFLPPRESDALTYHLPIIAGFYQSHAIQPSASLVVWVRDYPFNGELLSLWNLMFLGVDKFVDMPFLATIGFAILAVYGLARRLGAGRDASIVAAAVLGAAPTMIFQQVSTSEDAFIAAVFIFGVYAVLTGFTENIPAPSPERFTLQAISAGVAMGILVGTRFTGVLYAAVLGILLLYQLWEWIRVKNRPGKWRLFLSLGLCLGCMAVYSVYPYIRNWVVEGNPLAPFTLKVGNTVLFTGEKDQQQIVEDSASDYDNSLPVPVRVVRLWFEPYDIIYDIRASGLGPLWICLCVPAILPWAVASVRKRQWHLAVLFLAVVFAWLATPAFWMARYELPILLIGAIALAWIYDRLEPRIRAGIGWAANACLLFILVFTMDMVQLNPKYLLQYAFRLTDATRDSVPFTGGGQEVFRYIAEHTLAEPAVIGYTGLVHYIYPLYGPDFRNVVVDLPVDSAEHWQQGLENDGVRYIVVAESKPQYEWTIALPQYQPILEDEGYVLFERTEGE